MNEEVYKNAVLKVNIPILTIDNKWHRLFAVHGKPKEVKIIEEELTSLIAHQGELNEDLKSLKQIKSKLMKTIVNNMGDEQQKKSDVNMSENKRLIEETNAKISSIEDELIDLPRTISSKNKELMILTMIHCYNYMRINEQEEKEIDDWINEFRVKLKKNIIRKQNRKINNKEMYSYMHDIFGKDVIDLFDVRFEDFEEETEESSKDKKKDNKESEESFQEEKKYEKSPTSK